MNWKLSAAVAFVMILGVSADRAFADEPNMRKQPHANELGIWKSYSPKGLRGEFHNYDPIGLIAGDLIHTDCSINYTDPDSHKIYCFNSRHLTDLFRALAQNVCSTGS